MAHELIIKQGEDSGVSFPVLGANNAPVNLIGWLVRAQARRYKDSPTTLAEWTTEAGTAVAGNGSVTLLWTAAQTSAWQWNTGVYDIEVVSPEGKRARLVSGKIFLDKEVTR